MRGDSHAECIVLYYYYYYYYYIVMNKCLCCHEEFRGVLGY